MPLVHPETGERTDPFDLARRRTDAVDRAVRALFDRSPQTSVALLALGGYGRVELTPGSDVDLLFVHPDRGGEGDARGAAEAVLYPLWDAGVPLSHAVRTPEECLVEARDRVASLTALLDGRLLSGPEHLFRAAVGGAAGVARQDPAAFVGRLMDSRAEREGRFGHTGRTLEPDLKEGLGGLRDGLTMRWLGVLDEGGRWPGGEDLARQMSDLLLVRIALHLATGVGGNRLITEHQGAVAATLGITDEPRWAARDALIRDVGLAARWVDLAVDEGLARADPRRKRFAARRSADETEAFEDAGTIDSAGGRPADRWPPDVLAAFLRLLASGPEGGRALHRLNAGESLVRLIPGWADIRGRPQRDPYHRFPVDVHLLESVAEAARLISDPDEPFAAEAVRAVGAPEPLLVGALLHDIGKVGTGAHVAVGIQVAGRVVEKMGLGAETRADVDFLVREHLLLSDTATRRNIEDEDLILHVSARVGDQRRLAMLYLLTVADALATGPHAATPWRMGLIRELVAKVSRTFERGLMDRNRANDLGRAGSALRRALADRDPVRVDAFLAEAPPAYVAWVDPGDVAAHLDMVDPPPGLSQIRTHVRPGRTPGTYLLAVAAVDRLGLLGSVAGALSLSGLSILTAQVFTTGRGIALDAFEVRGTFEEAIGPERWSRFVEVMEGVLRAEVDLPARMEALRGHYRPPAPGIPVKVRISQNVSDFHTVVEVGCSDRVGLLFDLARTFADLGLDVHLAKVATYGPRVVDVFYVTEPAGGRMEDPERVRQLEAALIRAVSA